MYDRDGGRTTIRATLIGAAVIMVGVVVLLALVVGVIDQQCASDIERWLPLYPGADTVSQQHSFLRARGMGVTTLTLHTPDDRETVSAWYADSTQRQADLDPDRGAATSRLRLEDAPDGGTLIHLDSECAWY
jgi:hypothetical protein